MTTLPGRPHVQAVSTHHRKHLRERWELCSIDPDAGVDPAALAARCPVWRPAAVPGTVADVLRSAGELDPDHAPPLDDRDWWYRCVFAAEPNAQPGSRVLRFDGLATLADVWLNDQLILSSTDMFVGHEVDISSVLRAENTLLIRFRSLTKALNARRPRPRWRTKLVEHQQLRWFRTTLLGRMPGWSPPIRPIGPWRAITLESRALVAVEAGDVSTSWADSQAVAQAAFQLAPLGGAIIRRAVLTIGDEDCELELLGRDEMVLVSGSMVVRNGKPWWPHTHGDQPLYHARLVVSTDRGDAIVELGRVAFRSVASDTSGGGFAIVVNGIAVFCRGACWTTPDIVTLGAGHAGYESLLVAARNAGMNMLRVGGTMIYEADVFYDCCDRLGILVWQDFMFANMDYPADDAAFMSVVDQEVTSNLGRLRRHPSLAVLCGGSEVEQQAAMLGVPREQWGHRLFHEQLPAWCAERAPNVPYWPSSPSGGVLPFHTDAGVSHYYGVGAYLRPLDDARRSNVRFAAECLAFANVPDQATIDSLLPAGESPVHHPRWKARVPRDHGAGWDFEDVRDHYLESLFGEHPMRLRYADMDRYLALSRVVTGDAMARTIGEWRRAGSTCNGALLWFFQDLWAGAGWGLIDSTGRPKAAYYVVRRAMQPIAATITDEGVNGLHIHVANDGEHALDGELRVMLFRDGEACVASATVPFVVQARSAESMSADAVLGGFRDVSYAYRFGAAGHDLVTATFAVSGQQIASAFHFPLGLSSARRNDVGLTAVAEPTPDGSAVLTVRSERFAQFVAIDAGNALPDENYFHLAPGDTRVITVASRDGSDLSEVFLQPLNAHAGVRVAIPRMTSVRS